MSSKAAVPGVSEDGNWWWDGAGWRPLLTPDGHSRWNGSAWVRLPTPARPTPPPAGPPGATVPVPAEPAPTSEPNAAPDGRPSWLPADIDMPRMSARRESSAAEAPAPKATSKPAASAVPAAPVPLWREDQERDNARHQKWVSRTPAMALVAALLLGIGGVAYVKSSGILNRQSPVVLTSAHSRLTFSVGGVQRYHVHQTETGVLTLPNGQTSQYTSDLDAIESLEVKSVDSAGDATLTLKFDTVTGQIGGVPFNFNPARARPITLTMSPDGRIVSGGTNGNIGGTATTSVPGSDQFSSILPRHQVRQGQSWGYDYSRPNPVGSGTIHYATQNTFLRYDDFYGQRVAVIESNVTVPIDMLLNLSQLLGLYGQPSNGIPSSAAIKYLGNENDQMTSYVDLSGRILHAVDSSDFQFKMQFQGLPKGAAYAALAGTYQFGGHQDADMVRLDSSPSPSAQPA